MKIKLVSAISVLFLGVSSLSYGANYSDYYFSVCGDSAVKNTDLEIINHSSVWEDKYDGDSDSFTIKGRYLSWIWRDTDVRVTYALKNDHNSQCTIVIKSTSIGPMHWELEQPCQGSLQYLNSVNNSNWVTGGYNYCLKFNRAPEVVASADKP